MTFDLTVFPVDRALTYEEAAAEVDRASGWRLGFGHDRRLDPFLAEMERRYPGVRGAGPDWPPVEVGVTRGAVELGIAWSVVEELVPVICEVAYRAGLAVWDPQRELVGLPAPFAAAPLGPDGLTQHVSLANEAIGAVVAGTMTGEPFDDGRTQQAVSEQLRALGARRMSPFGFEITPELEDEVLADPTRYPPSLQTPDRRAALIAQLADPFSSERHQALVALSAWDADAAVAAALRPVLASDDVFEAGQAAQGLARQGDITDLPAVLNLVHRMSPDDGGTVAAMLLPVMAALSLASLAGPDAVAGVKARVASWRGTAAGRRGRIDADEALDAILAQDGGWR
jgi:hypothetical protein